MLRRRQATTAMVVLAATLALGPGPAPAHAGERWRWPVAGAVITPYRNGGDPYARGQHRGIDVAAAVGTPVVAATGGGVRFAGVAGSSGLTVSLRTADGRFDTAYLHLSRSDVRAGQRVAPGEVIGAVGTSGRRSASAPHLHFGVRRAGTRHAYRDPLDFLPPLPAPPSRQPPPGAPAPLPAPVRAAPHREPIPVPARRPARVRLRIPAGTRVPLPAATRLRRPVLPRLGPRPAPVELGRPRAPRHAGADRLRAPVPSAGPAPLEAPAARATPAARRSQLGSEPHSGGDARRGGIDLGWALACAGLLLAAACLGRPREGAAPRRAVRAAWRARLQLLPGRR